MSKRIIAIITILSMLLGTIIIAPAGTGSASQELKGFNQTYEVDLISAQTAYLLTSNSEISIQNRIDNTEKYSTLWEVRFDLHNTSQQALEGWVLARAYNEKGDIVSTTTTGLQKLGAGQSKKGNSLTVSKGSASRVELYLIPNKLVDGASGIYLLNKDDNLEQYSTLWEVRYDLQNKTNESFEGWILAKTYNDQGAIVSTTTTSVLKLSAGETKVGNTLTVSKGKGTRVELHIIPNKRIDGPAGLYLLNKEDNLEQYSTLWEVRYDLQNNTNEVFEGYILAKGYNEAGDVVSTSTTSLHKLGAGETKIGNRLTLSKNNAKRVELFMIPNKRTEGAQAIYILNQEDNREQYSTLWEVRYDLQNTTQQAYEGYILARGYDDQGNITATTTTNLHKLGAGETKAGNNLTLSKSKTTRVELLAIPNQKIEGPAGLYILNKDDNHEQYSTLWEVRYDLQNTTNAIIEGQIVATSYNDKGETIHTSTSSVIKLGAGEIKVGNKLTHSKSKVSRVDLSFKPASTTGNVSVYHEEFFTEAISQDNLIAFSGEGGSGSTGGERKRATFRYGAIELDTTQAVEVKQQPVSEIAPVPKDVEAKTDAYTLHLEKELREPTTLTIQVDPELLKDVDKYKLAIWKYVEDDSVANLTPTQADKNQKVRIASTGRWESVGGKTDSKSGSVSTQITEDGTYAVMHSKQSIPDIQGHRYQYEIEVLLAQGIISGYNEKEFRPNVGISRAEYSKIIVKAGRIPMGKDVAPFKDVGSSHWATRFIGAASKSKAITGYTNGNFGPNDKITREQAVAIVQRTGKLNKLNEKQVSARINKLSDGSGIASYARKPVAETLHANMITEVKGNEFKPRAEATRAVIAKMIMGLMIEMGHL